MTSDTTRVPPGRKDFSFRWRMLIAQEFKKRWCIETGFRDHMLFSPTSSLTNNDLPVINGPKMRMRTPTISSIKFPSAIKYPNLGAFFNESGKFKILLSEISRYISPSQSPISSGNPSSSLCSTDNRWRFFNCPIVLGNDVSLFRPSCNVSSAFKFPNESGSALKL
jgi:hypothetical protein